MNIRDLTYLVSLAKHKHFGKAAEACCVSQPALSSQIKKLEEFLGVQLIERTNKSMLITAAGHEIIQKSQDILQHIDALKNFAERTKNPHHGDLRLGIFPTLAPYFLPSIMPKLSKKFPALSIYLIEEKTEILMQKLMQGEIDVCVLALPISDPLFTTHSLFEEEFLLAISSKHILVKRKLIKPHEINQEDLLLLDEGHCLREQALQFCHRHNIKEHAKFRATSIETVRHMVASGMGMTLMPKLACTTHANLAYIPFSHPKPLRKIGLVWRKKSAKEILFKDLHSHLQKSLENNKSIKLLP